MKIAIGPGACPGLDIFGMLRKVKEHGFQGLEYLSWWNLEDLKAVAAEEERGRETGCRDQRGLHPFFQSGG
jgi:hydroxypyruvate isomerase